MDVRRDMRGLRIWSAARWVLIGAISAAQGVSGWYFTMLDVYGMGDFDGALGVSIVALPALLLLIALDFRTAPQRAVLRSWLVLRAIAVPLLGLGAGSLARVGIVVGSSGSGAHFDPAAADHAWRLMLLGAVLLAIQPLLAVVRRAAVALLGAPQPAAEPPRGPEPAPDAAAASEPAAIHTPRWPGSPLAKSIAGVLAFAVITGAVLTFAGRVNWHVAVSTAQTVPPMAATGTVDGRELVVVSYDERAILRPAAHERVAAFDLATGELVWDRRLPGDGSHSATVEAVLLDERGAFLRVDDHSSTPVWQLLDSRTGRVERSAEERNLLVLDDMDEAVPGIPGDVVERYLELEARPSDDGYDYVFTEDADIERKFRYDDPTVIVDPASGAPAGEGHGFTLHRLCCEETALESRAEDGAVLARIDGIAPTSREVVATTDDGYVVLLVEGRESKGRLIVASRDGFVEAVVGDRGWLPW